METIMEVGTRGQINDIYLIKKAQMGDKEAIEEIVTKFIPFIRKTCRKIYIRGYEIEDLIQMGQVSILLAINKYKTNRTYAFTTYAVNAVKINFYRLIKHKVNSISEISINLIDSNGYEEMKDLASKDNIEDEIIEKEEKFRLYDQINKLSHKDKEIIFWVYFENRSLGEYAREKGICYRAALKRKKSAIQNLRCQMR